MNTWILTMQNSNSPIFDLMVYFHDTAMTILICITLMISYIMFTMLNNLLINRYMLQGHSIELIWTITPIFILILIAIPSLKILYLSDDTHSSKLTVKTIGHQWYWSYEYSDFLNVSFDSFMINTNDLAKNEFRLLDVNNRCVLPYHTNIRILTTSMDVIHSWTIPSLGIKMDSTPGRLNQSHLYMYRPGLYFGQCSEICGINHSFMPIVIESTNFPYFKSWLMMNSTT